jgi:N-acetylglucosamine-6-phosphate deacetylase
MIRLRFITMVTFRFMQRSSFLLPLILSISSCIKPENVVRGVLYSDMKPVEIEIQNDRIVNIKRINTLPEGADNLIIAPGFIDNQVNGFAGISFTFGGGELTAEGVKKATEELWKTGVTTYLPTLTTNSHELLTRNFKVLSGVINDPGLLGSIPGFHLEGPYISPVDGFRGAHPLRYVRPPDWNEFLELNSSAGNKILEVTLAPETEGAMDFISRCREAGIIVGLGHHNGDARTINEAVENGASVSTHLGNGCANTVNRHINPLWPQLANEKLMISIIGDGFHLNPEEIKVFFKVKGPERTIITSDVTSYAALPPGKFVNMEGDTLELTPDGMVRYPAQNVLAGSASPIKKGIANVMKVTGCSLNDAVNMATRNPAQLYGFTDRGILKTGARADMVLFRIRNDEFEIEKTIVAGKIVFEKNSDKGNSH